MHVRATEAQKEAVREANRNFRNPTPKVKRIKGPKIIMSQTTRTHWSIRPNTIWYLFLVSTFLHFLIPVAVILALVSWFHHHPKSFGITLGSMVLVSIIFLVWMFNFYEKSVIPIPPQNSKFDLSTAVPINPENVDSNGIWHTPWRDCVRPSQDKTVTAAAWVKCMHEDPAYNEN